MFLLDTNTIIDYLKGSLTPGAMQMLSEIIDNESAISVITKIELLGFKAPNAEEDELAATFVEGSVIHHLTENIITQTITLRRNYKIKLPDAVIAATALVNQLSIVTRNTSDFAKIPGLQCVDPHSI